jgi:hypothetical protein
MKPPDFRRPLSPAALTGKDRWTGKDRHDPIAAPAASRLSPPPR